MSDKDESKLTDGKSVEKIILEDLKDFQDDLEPSYIDPLSPKKNPKFAKLIEKVDLSLFGRLKENIVFFNFFQTHCDSYGFYQRFISLLLLFQIFIIGNVFFSYNYYFQEPKFFTM